MKELEKKVYTVAVDLGTTNIVVIAGARNDDGTMQFKALVSKEAKGMQAGKIVNIANAGNSIRAALNDVEAELGTRVSEVYTGISGDFIRCESYTDHVFAANSQDGISQQDVDALYARMNEVRAPENEIIIERIPQCFTVDGVSTVEDPVGSFGRQLAATFEFVLCEQTPYKRLQMVFENLGIKLLGIYPTTMTVAESIATPDEREEGVAIVNLGGGKTDVTVVYKNIVRHVASVPMGGLAVNADIKSLCIPEKHVERMKIQYGSAVAEMTNKTTLAIPGRIPKSASGILDYNLATVIEARMMDIIDFVKNEIRDSGYENRLGYGIILMGGGSRMAHVADLFRRETSMDVRLAGTDRVKDGESPDKAAYATAQGILMRGIADGRSTIVAADKPRVPSDFIPAEPVVPQQPPMPADNQPAAGPSSGAGVAKGSPASPSMVTAPDSDTAAGQGTASKQESSAVPVREKTLNDRYKEVGKIRGTDEELSVDEPDDEEEEVIVDKPRKKRRGFMSGIGRKLKDMVNNSFSGDNDSELDY